MFPTTYFPNTYYPGVYFPPVGDVIIIPETGPTVILYGKPEIVTVMRATGKTISTIARKVTVVSDVFEKVTND